MSERNIILVLKLNLESKLFLERAITHYHRYEMSKEKLRLERSVRQGDNIKELKIRSDIEILNNIVNIISDYKIVSSEEEIFSI